jgi:tetratricopeptide (TPR) repeat protein
MANDFEKATLLFQQNKLNEAQVLFENYLKQNPNHTKSLEYLGDIAGAKKDWDSALKYYKKIKSQYPNNAEYVYKYGGVLGMQAKEANKFKALTMLDEVEQCFLTAIKLDSKHIDARMALVFLYMELPAIVGGSERKATKYAEEISQISKIDGLIAKGVIDEYNKNYSQAEKKYLVALSLDDDYYKTYQKLYDLYTQKMKNTTKAITIKNKMTQLNKK